MRIIIITSILSLILLANQEDILDKQIVIKEVPETQTSTSPIDTTQENNESNTTLVDVQKLVTDLNTTDVINENNETNLTIVDLQDIAKDLNETNTTATITPLLIKNDTIFQSDRKSGFTLAESIVFSLEKNPKIKASSQKIIQSIQKVKEENAGHLPVINLSGNAGEEARSFQEDYSSGTKVLAAQTSYYQYKKTELFLTITENLWSGGKIQGKVNEQESRLKAARYDHRDKIETAAMDIIRSYFDMVYGEISVRISETNMLAYTKILEIVKIKEENGAATQGDVNFILANVENARAAHVNTQAKLSDAIAQYEYLMQDVNESNMPFQTDVEINEKSLEESLEYMQENNAKLLRQQAYIQATSFSLKTQEAAYHPTLDFSINAESKNEYDEGLGQRDKVNALLTFNYNLYNGGKDEAAYLRILSTMNEQKYTYDDQMRKLVFDIKVLYRSVKSMRDSLKLTLSEVEAARKVVENYWVAFRHGTQDLQALQLAQRNLNRAELDYANYKKSLILNNFTLMKNTGELLKFLNIVNED